MRERERLQKELSWDELREKLKTAEIKPEHKCKKCVWADTESGYLFCSLPNCVNEQTETNGERIEKTELYLKGEYYENQQDN